MSDTTYDTLSEERESLIREIVSAVFVQAMPKIESALAEKFVTRDEIQHTLLDSLTNQVSERFDELDKVGESRHAEFVKHYEQRLETMATREEVAGIIAASSENAQRLTVLEATAETRLTRLEKRADQTEEIQRKQTESIQSMTQNTASIKDAVQAMERTYLQAMELDRKRQQDVDREITSLKDAQAQDTKDISAIRGQVSGLDSGVNALRGDVAVVHQAQAMVAEVKSKQDNHDERLAKAEQTVIKLDTSIGSFLWFFNNPDGRRVGGVLLGIFFFTQIAALVLLWRIASLGILAR